MGVTRTYTEPDYNTTQEYSLGNNVLSSGTGILGCFTPPVAINITGWKAVVMTAGNSANSGYKIYSGTTSIGSITSGTNAAGSVLTGTVTTTAIAATSYVKIGKKIDGDTLKANVSMSYIKTVP
jgi:hypothetical protein